MLSGIYRVQGFRVEGFGGSGPGVRGVGSLCFVGLGPTAWILDFDSEATAPLEGSWDLVSTVVTTLIGVIGS